ncbi:unnamed protein product [Rhizophagus irregularis]|uniref:Uncharacterized protein n=1 Tax=Rhizophagus irregularis TaxID=588596 RepID=A0A915YZG8_9GLOM|nr:unnamed protein product [Rhizophagus irregularis]
MKHTEVTLSKHPKVRTIIDPKTVICICGKRVRLDRNYDPDLLNRHVKNKICTSDNGNSQITQFFLTQSSETSRKRKLCIGLNDEKVKLYLHRVDFHRNAILLPLDSSYTLRSRAKWINDSTTFVLEVLNIQHILTKLVKFVDNACLDLKKSKVFLNAIDKPIPKEKNRKYTPLILYKNSPFYQYCKNANVMELLGYFNDPEDCTPKFWNQLARMGRSASSSPQTYAIFQKNLAGRTIRNIRVQCAQSDLAINNPSICFENMAKFRKFLNSINYDVPIAASSDNTKLEEKLRYSAMLIPKVPPFVLGIIPNNSENVSDVYKIHKQVLELATHFKIHILSIGADGASVEIKAQKNIMQINTETKLEFNDELYNVLNVDKQDNSAAYRLFSHEFLYEVSQTLNSDSKNKGLLIYLFIIGELIDSYLNRNISNYERIKMVMMGYICDYFEGNVNDLNSNLKIWPTDDEIRVLINDAYKEANALAKCVSIVVTLLPSFPIDNPSTSEIMPIEENSIKEFQNEEEILTEIAETIGNIASLNLQNNTDENLIDAREQITNLSNNTYLQQVYDSNLDILDNNGEIILDLLHQQ